mgnify:CR=1 FL=1
MPGLAVHKQRVLSDLIGDLGRVVVAYSGGVDSAFLTAVAHDTLGVDCLAVTAVSPSLARSELRKAADLARSRGWRHRTVGTHEVSLEAYAVNGSDRCYWCKDELFSTLEPIAAELDAAVIVGTNTDDLGDHRPGLMAAKEHRVLSPLVSAALSKAEIRELSAAMSLPTATKPSSPCLASRFAYGVRVTPAGLRRVEAAEDFVASLGFFEFRVRDHGELARLEFLVSEIPRATSQLARIEEHLRSLGYVDVTIDPKGFRSGSLNEALPLPTLRRSMA